MGERVLLAGCGDVGLRVAQRLRARGDEVWGLRRRGHADGGADLHWLAADLGDQGSLRGLPRGLTQLVYLPAPGRGDLDAYRTLFPGGLRNLLAALDQTALRRVLLVSSSAVYGDHAGAWVDELTPTAPLAGNGEALRDTEQWLAGARPDAAVVLRLAGLYGPGRLGLLARLREGAVGVPRQARHWANRLHVDDAAAAIAHLLWLEAPQPLYLGVDDTPLPLDVLYDELARLIGAPPPDDGPAPPQVGSKRLCNAQLRASGWAPRWPDARLGYAALFGQAVPGPDTV
ncbi:MAG: NAD-dependent epimerase/dehydratase family protein [Xanthomonadales bacterium]|nr:NAD-dependent epimerase/dehydratase family protein [Xanthomonadales bacterium]